MRILKIMISEEVNGEPVDTFMQTPLEEVRVSNPTLIEAFKAVVKSHERKVAAINSEVK